MSVGYWGNYDERGGSNAPPPKPPAGKPAPPKKQKKPPKKSGNQTAGQWSIDFLRRKLQRERELRQAQKRGDKERAANRFAQRRLNNDATRQADKMVRQAETQRLREAAMAAARKAAYDDVQKRGSAYLKQLQAYTAREKLIAENPVIAQFSGSSLAAPREAKTPAEIIAALDSERTLQTARGGQYHNPTRIANLSKSLDTMVDKVVARHGELDREATRLYNQWKGGNKTAGKKYVELQKGEVQQYRKQVDELFGSAPGELGAYDVAYHRIGQMQDTYNRVTEQQLDKYIKQHQPGPYLTGRASLPGYGNAVMPPIVAPPNTTSRAVNGVANPYYGLSTLEAKQAIAVGLEERERELLRRFFATYETKPKGLEALTPANLVGTTVDAVQGRIDEMFFAPAFAKAAKELKLPEDIGEYHDSGTVGLVLDRAVANFRANLMVKYQWVPPPVYSVAGGGSAFAMPVLPPEHEIKVQQFEKHLYNLVTDRDAPSGLERLLTQTFSLPFVTDAMKGMNVFGAVISTPAAIVKAAFGALGHELVAPQLHHEWLFPNNDSDPETIIRNLPDNMKDAFGTPLAWDGGKLIEWQETTKEGIAWYKSYVKKHPAYGGLIEFPNQRTYNFGGIPGVGTRENREAVQAEFDTLATQVRETGALAGPLEQFWALIDAYNQYSFEPFSRDQGNIGNMAANIFDLSFIAKPGILARIAMNAFKRSRGVRSVDLAGKSWTTMELLRNYRFGTLQGKEVQMGVRDILPKGVAGPIQHGNFRQFRDPLKEMRENDALYKATGKFRHEMSKEDFTQVMVDLMGKQSTDPTVDGLLGAMSRQFNADLTQNAQVRSAVESWIKRFISEDNIDAISHSRRTRVAKQLDEILRSIKRFQKNTADEEAAESVQMRQRGRAGEVRPARQAKQGLKNERSRFETEVDFKDPAPSTGKMASKESPRPGDYRAPEAQGVSRGPRSRGTIRYGTGLTEPGQPVSHAYVHAPAHQGQDVIAMADGIARDNHLGFRWTRSPADVVEGEPLVEFFGPADEVQIAAMKLDDMMSKNRLGSNKRTGQYAKYKSVGSGRVTYRQGFTDPISERLSIEGKLTSSRDLIDKKTKARAWAKQVRARLAALEPEIERVRAAYDKAYAEARASIPGGAPDTAVATREMEKLLAKAESLQRLARHLEQTGDLPGHVTLANKDLVLEGLRRDERFLLNERQRLMARLARAPNENARAIIQARIDWINDAIEGLGLLRGDRLGNFHLAEDLVRVYGDDAMNFVNGHSVAPLITAEVEAELVAGQQIWNLLTRTQKGGSYKPDEREVAAIRSMEIVKPMLDAIPSPNVHAMGIHVDGPFEAVFPVINHMILQDPEMVKTFQPYLDKVRDAVMAGPQTRARVKMERNAAARELVRLRKEAAAAKSRAKTAADDAVKAQEQKLANLEHLLRVTKDLKIEDAPKPVFYVRFAPGKFAHARTIEKQIKAIVARVPDHNVVIRVDRSTGSASAAAKVARRLGLHVEYVDNVVEAVPPMPKGGELERAAAENRLPTYQNMTKEEDAWYIRYHPRRPSARRMRATGEYFFNPPLLRERFRAQAWTNPRHEGVTPLPAGFFKTEDEYFRYAAAHEAFHGLQAQLDGESLAAYENRANAYARQFYNRQDEWDPEVRRAYALLLEADKPPVQKNLPDDVVIGMRVKTDVPFSPVTGTPRETKIKRFRFVSGGAVGADSMWDTVIKEFGGTVDHWVREDAGPMGNIGDSRYIHFNPQRAAAADEAVNTAATNMGKRAPRAGARSPDRVVTQEWVNTWERLEPRFKGIQTGLRIDDDLWLQRYFDEDGLYLYREGGQPLPLNPSRADAERHALYLDGKQSYMSLRIAMNSTYDRRVKSLFEATLEPREWDAYYLKQKFDRGDAVPTANTRRGRANHARLLMRRNYEIVQNSDEIYAIGQDLSAWDKVKKRRPSTFIRGVNGKQIVSGGTGWGVQMAIDAGKPVHVFDPLTSQWFRWDNTSGAVGNWIVEPVPVLSERAGLIGSRTVRRPVWEDGKIVAHEDNPHVLDVMREVVQKTIGADSDQALNTLNTEEWNTVLRARSIESSIPRAQGWEAEVVARSGTQESLGQFLQTLLLNTRYEIVPTQNGFMVKAGSMDDLRLISEAISTGASKLIADPGEPLPVMQRMGALPEHPPEGVKEVSKAGRFRLYRKDIAPGDAREAAVNVRLGGPPQQYSMQVTDNDMAGIQKLADANGVQLTIRRGYLRRTKNTVVDTARFEADYAAYQARFYGARAPLGQAQDIVPSGGVFKQSKTVTASDAAGNVRTRKSQRLAAAETQIVDETPPTIDDVEDVWEDVVVTPEMAVKTASGESNVGARMRVNKGKSKYKKTVYSEWFDESEGGWTVTFGFKNKVGAVSNERRFVRHRLTAFTKELDKWTFDHPETGQPLKFKGVTPGPGLDVKDGQRRIHGNVFAKFNDGQATSWVNGMPLPKITGKPLDEAPVHFTDIHFDRESGQKLKRGAHGDFRPVQYSAERMDPALHPFTYGDYWARGESEFGEYFTGTDIKKIRDNAEMEPMDATMPREAVHPRSGYFPPGATPEEMADTIIESIGLVATEMRGLSGKLAESIRLGAARQRFKRPSRTTVWNRSRDAPDDTKITKIEMEADAGVYVGRSTKSGIRDSGFGNTSRGATPEMRVRNYLVDFVQKLLSEEPTSEYGTFLTDVLALHGRRLVCWDKPDICHADVMASWLEAVANVSSARMGVPVEEYARAMAGHPLRGYPVKPMVNPNAAADAAIDEAEKAGSRVLVYEGGNWGRRGDWTQGLPAPAPSTPLAAAPPGAGGTGGGVPPAPGAGAAGGPPPPRPTGPPKAYNYAPDPEIPASVLADSPLEIARYLYSGINAGFKQETVLTWKGMLDLNKKVADAIAEYRGWRAKSAGRGPRFRKPEFKATDDADAMEDADTILQGLAVTTRDVRLLNVITKTLAKEGVPLPVYQSGLGVFRPAMVKHNRSLGVLRNSVANGTDFLTERQGLVRQESNAQLRSFASEAPYGMTSARAWEEFQLARARPWEEPAPRAFDPYEQDMANQALYDLLGVDPDDVEGVGRALAPIAPTGNNQAEARRWLMARGVWTPRQAEEVWGSDREPWTAKQEYDYYFNTWAVRPKWADVDYWLAKKAFDTQFSYEKLAMELGVYDRTVDLQLARSADAAIQQKLAIVYGDEAQGIKPARTIAEQREFMIHRWGDAIAQPISGQTTLGKVDDVAEETLTGPVEYQLVRAPWLMDPRTVEYHRFMGGANRDLIDASLLEPDMVDALSREIARVTEKRVALLLNNVGTDGVTLEEELNRLTLEIVDHLLDDPRWKPRLRLSKPKAFGGSGKRWYIGRQPAAYYLLSLLGKIQRLDVVTQIAFPVMNRFEISRIGPKRGLLWVGSRHFSDMPDEAIDFLQYRLPTLESFGISGDATSLWTMMGRSNFDRLNDAVGELREFGWNPETAWDAFTAAGGSAYEWGLLISRNAENELKLGFARRAYWDRYSSYIADGIADEEADVLARLATRDIVNHFFLTSENTHPFVKILNQFIPFFSYNWNTKTLYMREFLSHPWLIVAMDAIGQLVEDYNLEEWERNNPGLPYPNMNKARSLNILINGETFTFDLLGTSDVFRGVDTMGKLTNGSKIGDIFGSLFRVPHPWQNRVIGAIMGANKWEETFWVTDIAGWYNKLASDGTLTKEDMLLIAVRLGTFQTMYPMSQYQSLNAAYALLPEKARDAFLEQHPELQLMWHEKGVGKDNWWGQHTPGQAIEYEIAKTGIAALRDYWNNQLDAYIDGGGSYRDDDYREMKASYRVDVLTYKTQHPLLLDAEAYYMTPEEWATQQETWATEDIAQQYYAMDTAKPERADFKTDALYNEAIDDFYDMKRAFLDANPSVKELWAKDATQVGLAIQDQLDHAQTIYDEVNDLRKDIVMFEKQGREDMVKAAYDLIGLKYEAINIPTKAAMEGSPLDMFDPDKIVAVGGRINPEVADYLAQSAALPRSVITPGQQDLAFYNATPQERDKMLLDYMFRTNQPIDPNMLSSKTGEIARLTQLVGKIQKSGSWDPFWAGLKKDKALREYWFSLDPTGQREVNWHDAQKYMSLMGPAAAFGKRTGDWSRFWDLLNNNEFVREQYFKHNPGAEAKYYQNKQYLGAMGRWTTLLDRGNYERAREYFQSLPGWMKKKYYDRHPESLHSMKQSAYVGYMRKWTNYFENDDGNGGMDYFWRMPSWVREHYFDTHPGKEQDFIQDREYFNYMGRWIKMLDADDPNSFKYFDSMPQWVKDRYRKNNPDSKMFNRGGMSDAQYKAYGNYMKTWTDMMDRKDPGAFDYFDSMPQWVKDQYRKNNPDSKMFGKHGGGSFGGGNWGYYSKSGYSWKDDEVNASELASYLMLHPQDQLEYLGSHPKFAAYLRGRDDGQWTHRQMILNAYTALPPDPWIKRAFKERYPEVFSDEALGEYKTAKVEAKLLAAPSLRDEYEQALAYLTSTYLGQAHLYGALPKRPELVHQTALIRKRRKKRMARRGARHELEIPKLLSVIPGLYNVKHNIA